MSSDNEKTPQTSAAGSGTGGEAIPMDTDAEKVGPQVAAASSSEQLHADVDDAAGSSSDGEAYDEEDDDEATIEEEELAAAVDDEPDDDDELAALQMEQDLPIEELLRRYAGRPPEASEAPPHSARASAEPSTSGGAAPVNPVKESESAESETPAGGRKSPAETARTTRSALQYVSVFDRRPHQYLEYGTSCSSSAEHNGTLALLALDATALADDDDDADYVPPPPKVLPSIRVGDDYQAPVPDWTGGRDDDDGALPSTSASATPLWLPQPVVDAGDGHCGDGDHPKVVEYLSTVASLRGRRPDAACPCVDDADALYCYFQSDYKQPRAVAAYKRHRARLLQRCNERAGQMDKAAERLGARPGTVTAAAENGDAAAAGDESDAAGVSDDLKELQRVAATWDMIKAHGDNADHRVDACAFRSWPFADIECELFEQALVQVDGKKFNQIAKEQMHGLRTQADLVAYYYMWKKSERAERFMQSHSKVLKRRQTHYADVCDYALEHLEFITHMSRSQPGHYALAATVGGVKAEGGACVDDDDRKDSGETDAATAIAHG